MSDDAFHNPFFRLNKDLQGRKKKRPDPAQAQKTPGKDPEKAPPAALLHDFSGEDEAAAAMFLAAVGGASARKAAPNKAEQGQGEPPAPPRARAEEPAEADMSAELSADEASSFARAMQGVRPVDESRGRALAPPPPPQPASRRKGMERDYLAEFTEGKYEFALEYTEEFFEGHVMWLDPLIIGKLRAGQYSPEKHIDLHGLNAEQAHAELAAFIKSAYLHDRRHLIVVTGRGKNSPGGLGVLRQNTQDWLTREPLRRVVLAFCTAQPKDGGAGALYVLLRKFKKNQGKVRWDISPSAAASEK